MIECVVLDMCVSEADHGMDLLCFTSCKPDGEVKQTGKSEMFMI